MIYSENEILQYIDENDVKFVKLTFCDLHGRLKNISILSSELAATFKRGAAISARKLSGFEAAKGKDLFLFPDAQTMTVLPWRPQQGRVIRMFCYIRYADGTPFEGDGRYFLKKATKAAVAAGYSFRFGTSCEFTLFKLDENGLPTKIPHDLAGYCDIAPDDKGENIRRDVCLTLEQMGIHPISSRHESGCGQHEIDFNSSSALKAADTFLSFKSAVKSVAANHEVHASFMPKPIRSACGNGMHISFTIFPDSDLFEEQPAENAEIMKHAAAGIMSHIRDFTRMSCDCIDSPVELRAADCVCEPYFVFGLMIYAALEGISENQTLPEKNVSVGSLPLDLSEAAECAERSEFIRKYISPSVLEVLLDYKKNEWKEYTASYDKDAFEDKKYFYSL